MTVREWLAVAMFGAFIVGILSGFPVAWVLGGVAVIFTAIASSQAKTPWPERESQRPIRRKPKHESQTKALGIMLLRAANLKSRRALGQFPDPP